MNADQLRALIDGLAGLPYGGEAVDQREHALQAASLALAAGADDELVAAALLHDVGRAEPVRMRHPGLAHEAAGAAFCRDLVGERAAWLVGSHAEAKRYLLATDPTYGERLSPASRASLEVQGGPMPAAEVLAFERHPWAADAVRLRRWDDEAKVPGAPTAGVDMLVEHVHRVAEARLRSVRARRSVW